MVGSHKGGAPEPETRPPTLGLLNGSNAPPNEVNGISKGPDPLLPLAPAFYAEQLPTLEHLPVNSSVARHVTQLACQRSTLADE